MLRCHCTEFKLNRLYVTNTTKKCILSTFVKVEIFAMSNRGFDKLSNDTQFLKIEVILLEIQLLRSLHFSFIFFIFCTLFCSLSQNIPVRQDFVVLGHVQNKEHGSYFFIYLPFKLHCTCIKSNSCFVLYFILSPIWGHCLPTIY